MFDDIYSSLTRKYPYKTLIFIPILISVLMLGVVLINGVPMGIDFRGGTLIQVVTGSFDQVESLKSDLTAAGLEDLTVYKGTDLESGKVKIKISTTSVGEDAMNAAMPVIETYFGAMHDSDEASIQYDGILPEGLEEKLSARLGESVDVLYDREAKTLKLTAFDLDEAELGTALSFYLDQDVSVDLQERNLNVGEVKPSLGEKLREEGLKAAVFGYLLMAVIIFLAFRDFIPSIAVLMAATCDAVITLGLMSLFDIMMEPASLVALLMLVGYSVDSDILLTTRLMKRRGREIDEAVDSAIKTGLTMTGTTFVVMVVVYVVSSMLDVSTLTSIASVLVLGLVADVMTTWLMNAGMLKWYLEEKKGAFSLKNISGRGNRR